MLELKNISKSFNERIIFNDFNLKLPDTGIVLFHGENGSGKSTLLNIISNSIKYEGKVILDNDINSSNIYYLESEKILFGHLSVKSKAKLLLNDNELTIFYEYLNKYNLDYLINYKIGKLSNGERQKVELLYALSKRASIILLDEPLEYIDIDSKPLLLEEIYKVAENSLIILSSPQDYINYDVLLEFKRNQVDVLYNNANTNNNEVIKNKHKRLNLFDYLKITFNSKLIVSLIFNLVISVLLFFVMISTNLINITKEEQLKSVLTNDPGIYKDVVKDGYNRRVENHLFVNRVGAKVHPIIIVESIVHNENKETMDKIPFIFSKKYKPKSILESNNIYIDGINTKINDYEVYISDYMYDYINSIEIAHQELIPTVPYTELDKVTYNFDYIGKVNARLKLKVYKTDYKEYIPTSDEILEKSEYKHELDVFKERVENYYGLAIVNTNTFDSFFNVTKNTSLEQYKENVRKSYEEGIVTKYDYNYSNAAFLYYYDESVISVGYKKNNVFLEDNEVYFNYHFARDYLNISNSSDYYNLNGKIIDFTYNGYQFKNMKFVSTLPHESFSFPDIKLSYAKACEVINTLDDKEAIKDLVIYDTRILNDNYDKITEDYRDFMHYDLYKSLVDNKTVTDKNLEQFVAFITISLFTMIIVYYLMYLRRERKIIKLLSNKGFTKAESFISYYLIRTIILVSLLTISIICSYLLVSHFALKIGLLI